MKPRSGMAAEALGLQPVAGGLASQSLVAAQDW